MPKNTFLFIIFFISLFFSFCSSSKNNLTNEQLEIMNKNFCLHLMLDKDYLPEVEVNIVDSFIFYGLKNESLVFFDTLTNISYNPTVVYNPDTFQKFILDWKYVRLIQTDKKFIDVIYYNSNRDSIYIKTINEGGINLPETTIVRYW